MLKLPMAKHSGLREMSSIATSLFEEYPLDASNCSWYLQMRIVSIKFNFKFN